MILDWRFAAAAQTERRAFRECVCIHNHQFAMQADDDLIDRILMSQVKVADRVVPEDDELGLPTLLLIFFREAYRRARLDL